MNSIGMPFEGVEAKVDPKVDLYVVALIPAKDK
jgi:hypothetical protein